MRAFLSLLLLFSFSCGASAEVAVMQAWPGKNTVLNQGESLVSPSGQFVLFMQHDGNLVVYRTACGVTPNCSVWNSGTSQNVTGAKYELAMQEDGNLVVYSMPPGSAWKSIWSSGSNLGIGEYYYVMLQDDSNLVVYRGRDPAQMQGAIWSIQTGLIEERGDDRGDAIKLASMRIDDCRRAEWRQFYNATSRQARQDLYVYAYIDRSYINSAKTDIQQCAAVGLAACALSAYAASTSACLPAMKAAIVGCLDSRGVVDQVIDSLSLSVETSCDW